MALTTIPLPYGLRDVGLTPYTDAAATTLGTKVDLPYARTLSFSESEEFTELRGDDRVVTTRGSGASVDWDLEAGGLSLEAYKVLAGGAIVESGTTPAQVKTYTKLGASTRPFFKIEGQAISDSGGDIHGVLYKCRATGSLDGEFGDSQFWLTSGSGVCIPSTLTAEVDTLYKFIQNETAVAIT